MPINSIGQECQCGDVDGLGGISVFNPIEQLDYLKDFLLGDSLLIDSSCADVDYGEGITVGDLGQLYNYILFDYHDGIDCLSNTPYSYAFSESDTIYVPRFLNIPEEMNNLLLPVYISYGNEYGPATAHIPFLSSGSGTNSVFQLMAIDSVRFFGDSRMYSRGDTSSIIHVDVYGPSRLFLAATLNYERMKLGVGQVVPEIMDNFLGRPMAVWHDKIFDLVIPVIKTYDVSTCCYGSSGNVDCDPANSVDISDLTFLIDHLFINFPELCCRSEANIDVDSDVSVDIADLTMLIDHLFINFKSLQSCQLPYLDN